MNGSTVKIYVQRKLATSPVAAVNSLPHDLGELRALLARRQRENAELEQQVHALQEAYREEIAPLQEEVLRLQKERLKEAAQVYMRSARLRNAYHDAQRAYESFQEHRQGAGARHDDLKGLYRRASKECHPDVVPESYREEASATFQALESAYEAGHPSAVENIAEALQEWGFPAPPAASPEGKEGTRVADLRRAVSALEASIERLRASEAYETARQASTLDTMVAARKRELLRKLQELQRS